MGLTLCIEDRKTCCNNNKNSNFGCKSNKFKKNFDKNEKNFIETTFIPCGIYRKNNEITTKKKN